MNNDDPLNHPTSREELEIKKLQAEINNLTRRESFIKKNFPSVIQAVGTLATLLIAGLTYYVLQRNGIFDINSKLIEIKNRENKIASDSLESLIAREKIILSIINEKKSDLNDSIKLQSLKFESLKNNFLSYKSNSERQLYELSIQKKELEYEPYLSNIKELETAGKANKVQSLKNILKGIGFDENNFDRICNDTYKRIYLSGYEQGDTALIMMGSLIMFYCDGKEESIDEFFAIGDSLFKSYQKRCELIPYKILDLYTISEIWGDTLNIPLNKLAIFLRDKDFCCRNKSKMLTEMVYAIEGNKLDKSDTELLFTTITELLQIIQMPTFPCNSVMDQCKALRNLAAICPQSFLAFKAKSFSEENIQYAADTTFLLSPSSSLIFQFDYSDFYSLSPSSIKNLNNLVKNNSDYPTGYWSPQNLNFTSEYKNYWKKNKAGLDKWIDPSFSYFRANPNEFLSSLLKNNF